MTVTELYWRLAEIINDGHGSDPLIIHAVGAGLRSDVTELKNVTYGFDWTKGKVILNPIETLVTAKYMHHRLEKAKPQ